MKIAEAVKLAEKSDDVKKLSKDGYYLNSAMAFLESGDKDASIWDLVYYEPTANKSAQIVVENGEIFLKEIGTPVKPTKETLTLSEVKTSSEKMLTKAGIEFQKYKQPLSQIILTIQKEGDKTVWKVNYITKMLYLVSIALDAKTGDLLSSEMHSLSK